MYRVVFDTNIIVSAHLKSESLPRLAFKAVLRRYAQLYVTEAILNEYENVLSYPKLKFNTEDIQAILSTIRKHSKLTHSPLKGYVNLEQVPENLVKDPNDKKFLACALRVKVQYIVTGDKKAFKFSEYEGILVVNARDFIGELGLGILGELEK